MVNSMTFDRKQLSTATRQIMLPCARICFLVAPFYASSHNRFSARHLTQGVLSPASCSPPSEGGAPCPSNEAFLALPLWMRTRPSTDTLTRNRLKKKEKPSTPLIKAKTAPWPGRKYSPIKAAVPSRLKRRSPPNVPLTVGCLVGGLVVLRAGMPAGPSLAWRCAKEACLILNTTLGKVKVQ